MFHKKKLTKLLSILLIFSLMSMMMTGCDFKKCKKHNPSTIIVENIPLAQYNYKYCTYTVKECPECKEDVTIYSEHIINEYVSNNDATCQKDGTKSGLCQVCNNLVTVVEQGTKINHNFTTYLSDNNATCTSDGTKSATCTFEGCTEKHTISDVDSKLNHNWGEWEITSQPQYQQEGQKQRICLNDDSHIEFDVVPALEHDLEFVEKVEATCYTDGCESYYKCKVDGCNKIFKDSICKLEITDVTTLKIDKTNKHIYEYVEGSADTTNNKANFKCSVDGCTDIKEDVDIKLSSTFISTTCENKSYYIYKCESLGLENIIVYSKELEYKHMLGDIEIKPWMYIDWKPEYEALIESGELKGVVMSEPIDGIFSAVWCCTLCKKEVLIGFRNAPYINEAQ